MQPHDILLLMTSLSQLSDAGQVIRIFIQAVNDALAPAQVRFAQDSSERPVSVGIPLRTLKANFGMIAIDAETPPSPADLELLQTACLLLSVVLENLAQRERLRSHRDMLWELAADPILVADEETGRLIDANQAATKLIGRTLDELRGLPFESLHPAEQMEHCRKLFAATSTSENCETIGQCALLREDGPSTPVEIRGRVATLDGRKVVIGIFHDLTERRRAEEALRQSEQRFRLAQQASQSGVWERNLENDEVYWSDNVEALFGIERGTFAADYQAYLNAILPDDRERIAGEIADALANGVGFTIEYRVVWPDGSIHWLTDHADLFKDANGRYNRLVGTVHDITERKLAKEAIEKRIVALTRPLDDVGGITFEELFNLDDVQRLQDDFAQATGVASIITQADGTPITAPSKFCRLCKDVIRKTDQGLENCFHSDATLGRVDQNGPVIQKCLSGGLWDAGAPISVGGKHVANWLIGQVRDETQREEDIRAYARQIGADENAAVEAFHKVPTMSREQFEHIAQALFTFATQLSAIAYQNVQQARFITERKRAERELREHREHLEELVRERTAKLDELNAEQQLILDSVRAMIWYKDTENNVLRINRAAADMLGMAAEEIKGNSIAELFPQDAELYRQNYLKVLQTGQPLHGIVELIRTASGEVLSLLSDIIPIKDAAGVVTGIIVFAIDITERILAEENLEKRSAELHSIVRSMAGRENRMAELKNVIRQLRAQLEKAGVAPVANF